MKIVMVSGSWPPERCGVGDYSDRLASALGAAGAEVVRFGGEGATRSSQLVHSLGRIRQIAPDVVHIQYPTAGYRRSIGPSLLAAIVRCPVVVTLHEFTRFRFYRMPWFLPFAFAQGLVFTSAHERTDFLRRLRHVPRHCETIPIGSNIPVGPDLVRDPRAVCSFGLLMPDKGLEQFLTLAKSLAGRGYRFSLIGSIPEKFRAYGEAITAEARALGVQVFADETPDGVARQLRLHTYAYLPYPDGATDKRGSLLATLVNGLKIMAPLTDRSHPPIRDCVVEAGSPEQAARILAAVEAGDDPWSGINLQAVSSAFEWQRIAQRHLSFYMGVVRTRSQPASVHA